MYENFMNDEDIISFVKAESEKNPFERTAELFE